MTLDSCAICGATEDLVSDEDMNYRKVWICQRGQCGFEWQREMRDSDEMAYQEEHDALDDRYGRRF